MADDVNPGLRAELVAADALLVPVLRGLRAMRADPVISPEKSAALDAEIAVKQRRRDLQDALTAALDAATAARNALEADGYPALPNSFVSAAVITELNQEMTDIQAAVAVFTEAASAMAITLGEAAPRTPPAPPTP